MGKVCAPIFPQDFILCTKKKRKKRTGKKKKNIYNVEIMMVIKMIATIYYANE